MLKTYQPDFSFGSNKDPDTQGRKLDMELTAISKSLADVAQRLSGLQNDDGSLRAGAVDAKALDAGLSLFPSTPTNWLPGREYRANMVALVDLKVAWCTKSHKSSTKFADDAKNWEVILDFTPYFTKMEQYTRNPALARIDANLDKLVFVAEKASQLTELVQNMEKLMALAAKIPDLEQLLDDGGAPVLKDIRDNLGFLVELAQNKEAILELSVLADKIYALGQIPEQLEVLGDAAEDVKRVSSFLGQVQQISAGAKGIAGE